MNTVKKSITDLDVKILALLHKRMERDNKGYGVYLLQKKINQAGRDKFIHDEIIESLDNLNQRKLVRYHDEKFWMITELGREYSEDCKDEIRGYDNLQMRLYLS